MPPMQAFQVARLPEIHFGRGTLARLPELIRRFGESLLLVTGRSSFLESTHWFELQQGLQANGLRWQQLCVEDEPSPELVDAAVTRTRDSDVDVVVAIGGGSVLDAAKAIAGLLRCGDSVMAYLEGVGEGRPYHGPTVPLVAVPTTAGTGSEATKNAVLSRRSADGFKKSFRDERLVAQVAVVDPALLQSCSKPLLAANGMDAFTQLLESYVSLRASPFTNALAASGMQAFRDGFWPTWEGRGQEAEQGLDRIAYASLCSGVTLAQAGLGAVHGLASPLGAFFPIPHGVVCGTLVAAATRCNIEALRDRDPNGSALRKYAEAGALLNGGMPSPATTDCDALIERLENWTERLGLPRLSEYGVSEADLPRLVANCRGGSMQTNPIRLSDDELTGLLRRRL